MKTKLDLYLAAHDEAVKTMTATTPIAAVAINELIAALGSDDKAFASQIFWSRRQRMQELAAQPLTVAETKPVTKPKAS